LKKAQVEAKEIGEDFLVSFLKEVKEAQRQAAVDTEARLVERFCQKYGNAHVFVIGHPDYNGERWLSVFASYQGCFATHSQWLER